MLGSPAESAARSAGPGQTPTAFAWRRVGVEQDAVGEDTSNRSPQEPQREAVDPFAEVVGFLRTVGQHSLFDYYGLAVDADPQHAREAVDARRRWAQAQQSNPKFQDEARWLLRNHALVMRVLVERRDAYLRQLDSRRVKRAIEQFDLFVRGSLASGVDSLELDRAAAEQARSLGLSGELAVQHLREARAAVGPQAESAPRRGGLSKALLAAMHDCVARGDLSPSEVSRVLEEGRKRQMSDHALQRVLEAAASRAARRRQEPGAAEPSRSPSLDGSLSSRSSNPLDAQLRGDAIRELVDTVRGALLMGVMSTSTLVSVQRRGSQMGLDQRSVELVVAEACRACEQAQRGELNAYGVLGVDPTVDQEGLRQAYQSCRRWALDLPDLAECHRSCVLVDVAWSLVRDPRSRARYDQRAQARASG